MPTSTVGNWDAGRRLHGKRRGLTLIELLAVMAIIVVTVGLVVPSFISVLAGRRLRSGARDLLAQCRYARDLAVRKRSYARVTLDQANKVHGVSLLVTDATTKQKDWQLVSDSLGGPHALPTGVTIDRVISSDPSGEAVVSFFPDGRGQDFYVALKDADNRRLGVHVAGTTGTCEVLSPEDFDRLSQLAAQGNGK